jgi:hypothetical protein
MEMNFAANSPDSVWAYHVLAMSHEANGEIDKAKGLPKSGEVAS